MFQRGFKRAIAGLTTDQAKQLIPKDRATNNSSREWFDIGANWRVAT
jgi:hypothetical protein